MVTKHGTNIHFHKEIQETPLSRGRVRLFTDASTFSPKNASFSKYSRMEHGLIKEGF